MHQNILTLKQTRKKRFGRDREYNAFVSKIHICMHLIYKKEKGRYKNIKALSLHCEKGSKHIKRDIRLKYNANDLEPKKQKIIWHEKPCEREELSIYSFLIVAKLSQQQY